MKLPELGLQQPHTVIVVILAVLVIGMVSVTRIPVDLLPIFKTSAVQIVTFYPGMPPEVMERDIMSRLERWTGQSVGIEHQEGKAMLGVCIVKDYFREGVSLETAMSQVTSYAMSDLFYLPPGTVPPMVMPFDPTATVPLCLVSISSPTMSEQELYDVAYFELRNRLQSIQGVIAPAVYGGVLRRILAYLDPEKLEASGLSPMDVVNALRQQNVFIPAGNMKAGGTDYQIFANAMPPQVADLNDIPIRMVNGKPVFLRDVARAEDSHQIQSNVVRVNGRRQVYIPIYRQPGANTLEIVDAIKGNLRRILQRVREMNPKAGDLALEIVLDQSTFVRSAIAGLMSAGAIGALLAGIVVLVFLGSIRSTLIIVLAIPISILAAFIGLFYSGETINAMTLGGLALAVGILVDQSIVVLENTQRHLAGGKSPRDAALEGAQEVALPILVSTLTFIVVFYPIVFLSGMARYLFTPLAVAATLAIVASYVFSIVVIPAYCGRFLRTGVEADSHQSTTWIDRLSNGYGRVVAAVLVRRRAVLLVTGVLFGAAVIVLLSIGRELFPPVDSGQFQILVRLPTGTRMERTEETIAAIEEEIIRVTGEPDPEYPERERFPNSNLRMLIANIGVLMDWPAAYTPNSGPMDAFVLVQLKGKGGAPGTFDVISTLRTRLPDRFPGAEFAFDAGGMMTAALNMGETAPIRLQVAGSNLQTSRHIAAQIGETVRSVPGVTDVRIAQRLDYPSLKVDIDRTRAAFVGLDARDIVTNLVTATNSSINFQPAFWIDERNGNHYFLGVQYPEDAIVSFGTIKDLPLTGSSTRRPIRLREVADFDRATGPAEINHHNITRIIDVYAGVEPGSPVGTVVERIESRLRGDSTLGLAPRSSDRGSYFEISGPEYAGKGYALWVKGEANIMREAFRQFIGGLTIAAILVYLVMVSQFRSFRDPVIVMLTVPLGFIGVSFMLATTGTALSIPSLMGIIMTVGIVIEYSVVMMDFANQRVRDGASPTAAITEAARLRLRPVLMTSLTTLFAIVPMAIGVGRGDVNVPLARAIVGGVLGATILSLVVLPCLYVTFKRDAGGVEPQR